MPVPNTALRRPSRLPGTLLKQARLRHSAHLLRKGMAFAQEHGLDKREPQAFAEAQRRLKEKQRQIRRGTMGLSPDERYDIKLETTRLYQGTPWGKEVNRRAAAKTNKSQGRKLSWNNYKYSVKGRLAKNMWMKSDKGKVVGRKAQDKYRKTPKGIIAKQRWAHSEKAKRQYRFYRSRKAVKETLEGKRVPRFINLRYALLPAIGEQNSRRLAYMAQFFSKPALMRIFKTVADSEILWPKRLDEKERPFIKARLSAAARQDVPLSEFYQMLNSFL
ncbi:MAG: hypothetical protein AABW72_01385 [archaeon]